MATSTTDFQRSYSQFVLAVWDNPGLEKQIESNPSLLTKYGFQNVPSKVNIEPAKGGASFAGYAQQQAQFQAGSASATLYVPPKPAEGATATDGDTYCCCCCPCCTCT